MLAPAQQGIEQARQAMIEAHEAAPNPPCVEPRFWTGGGMAARPLTWAVFWT